MAGSKGSKPPKPYMPAKGTGSKPPAAPNFGKSTGSKPPPPFFPPASGKGKKK